MRVLISGAGIAGPTLAWFLARAGARITVIEKAPALYPHGQNIDITGSAITAVKKMELMYEFRRCHTKEEGSKFIDPKGGTFAHFPLRKGGNASFTSEFEILRGDLAALLYEATKDHPRVEYRFGTTIKQVLKNDDDEVQVELSTGELATSDVLVAADGQWSNVRKQCYPPDAISVRDTGMYAVYYTVPRLPSDDDWWNIYQALGSRIITVRPDPHGTVRAMFTCMPLNETQKKAWQEASRADRKTQQELLKREFFDAGWQAQRLLDAVDHAPDFYFQVLQQIRMSKWSNNRVICLGDTAYAPTPLTGMGTTLAIVGAYVLAGELRKLDKGSHPSKAFDAYEKVFRPFVEQQQQIPPFVPDIAHPATPFKRWIFSVCMSAIAKLVSFNWVSSRFGNMDPEKNNGGFPLPEYPTFDATDSKEWIKG